MSDLNKDIEKVRELLTWKHKIYEDELSFALRTTGYINLDVADDTKEAIENVLLRLEEWEKTFNLIDKSAVRIDNTPTTSTLEVDLNKLFTHIGFLDNETLVNIKLKNTTRYRVDLDTDKSELETYKKIAERLAEVVDLGCIDITCSPMCVHDNCIKECTLDWARNEVENEG